MVTDASIKKRGHYNWKHDKQTKLVYLGWERSSGKVWHQFAKVDDPTEAVWCEVPAGSLELFEETQLNA